MKLTSFFFLFLFWSIPAFIQAQHFQTLTYYENDSVKLELDLFMPNTIKTEKIPLLIFVHGGGFSGGDRTGGHAISKFFAERGIAAATISYSLYMKGKDFGCKGNSPEKVKAIQIAANQLWLATAFFIENQDKFHIDTTNIFISGSSAGAETVLHAAFWDRTMMGIYAKKLPETFRYAGLISGAGAIMDLNLIQNENLLPVMMFHGDADPLVPYRTAAHHFCPPNLPGWLMLFGSESIYQHISKLNGTVQLISYTGGSHNIAGAYFYQDQQPVYDFVVRILNDEHFQSHLIKMTD